MRRFFGGRSSRGGAVRGARILFFLSCLFAVLPLSFGQDFRLSKQQATGITFAAFAPSFITSELNRWIPGVDPSWEVRYGVLPLGSLGFLLNGQWEEGLILGGIDAAAVTGAYFARPSFPLSSFTGMTASHLSFYTQYEIYKSSRTMVDPASYRFKWKPVDMAEAALAPFRFDYLADPFVSFFLLGESSAPVPSTISRPAPSRRQAIPSSGTETPIRAPVGSHSTRRN